MSKHTPGPWVISEARSTKVDLINTRKGDAVGEVVFVDLRNPADAMLVAAAPDLLQALYHCEDQCQHITTPNRNGVLAVIRAAIFQATGKQLVDRVEEA